jgi:hypothetical protein
MRRRGPRWIPRRRLLAGIPVSRSSPLRDLFPATLEQLCAHWRRHHPEDADLTDAQLEELFSRLQNGGRRA